MTKSNSMTAPNLTDDADLVDRLFDYLLQMEPSLNANADRLEAMKDAVRDEFGGIEMYIRQRRETRSALAIQVLSLFNGRNATEVARRLCISRATVYRLLKQPGNEMTGMHSSSSQFSGK